MAWNGLVHSNRARWLWAFATLVLLSVGGGGLGHAADPSKDAKQEAKARFTAGQNHYNLNEFTDALREFKEAYRLYPDPVFLYNLGQCERQLGHSEEAIRFYRSFLREQPKAPNRQEVLNKIAEMEAATKSKQAEAEKAAPPPLAPAKPVAPPVEARPVAPPPAPLTPPAPPASGEANAAVPATQPALPLPTTPPVTPETAGGAPDRVDLTESQAPPPETGEAPIYKRWWFWTAAAVVVVGAGVGIWAATSGGGGGVPASGLGSKKVF